MLIGDREIEWAACFKNIAVQAHQILIRTKKLGWIRDIFKQWIFDGIVLKLEKHLEEKKIPRQALNR